ncbi:hypothetical protein JVU11DRAFT_6573 [Chiua virens]|nr:hypothetical protein JVU11DRAFT_6573 [Chiua virens]
MKRPIDVHSRANVHQICLRRSAFRSRQGRHHTPFIQQRRFSHLQTIPLPRIPQPAEASEDQEIKDGLVVVPMAEDSKTLDSLLRFCYPSTLADDPNLEVLEDVIDVLEAAKKYSLESLEKKICRTLSNPKILEAEPLRCFAIAHRGDLREETRLAAKYTLSLPLVPSWFNEIGLITAADLLALLTYHRKCGDAISLARADALQVQNHCTVLMFSNTPTSTKPAYAAAPFDHAKADIILRSSDNVDFRIFKLFLSLASPFFETLFDLPQPAKAKEDQKTKDGLVVVPVTECSKTLDALLRFCYPSTLTDDPNLEVLEDVTDVLEAAKKYSLESLEKKICRTLSNPKILNAESLRFFAIAHRGGLREETRLAAKYTLTQSLVPSWFKEIGLITAADLLALLTYHRFCGDAVYALKTDMSWIKTHYGSNQGCAWLSGQSYSNNRFNNCSCPRSLVPKFLLFNSWSLQWWEDFMEETFVELRDKPCKATIENHVEKAVQSVKGRNCPTCSPHIEGGMQGLTELFTKKLDEVISQFELDFTSQVKSQIPDEDSSRQAMGEETGSNIESDFGL